MKRFKVLKMNADTLTPVRIFQLLKGEKKFLLESTADYGNKGRYSFIGADPFEEIIGYGKETIIRSHRGHKEQRVMENALRYLKENFIKIELHLPFPFIGGAVGYIGYDIVREFYPIGKMLPDELEMPDVHLMLYQTFIVYEHLTETVYLVTLNLFEEDENVLEDRLLELKRKVTEESSVKPSEPIVLNYVSEEGEQIFQEKIKRAKEYIQKGDASQIVVSQRMKAKFKGDPFSYYRQLRYVNPSPYMFYIDFNDYLILGASPESLIKTAGRKVMTNPIAGTRQRGKTEKEDQRLVEELMKDPKEISEHKMLVELSKRELQTICKKNSLTTPLHMEVHKFQHVMHLVSEVHGELKEDLTSIDALLATFPAGTVSGTPKVRAMQIINELEDVKRGFYGGGVGYIAFNGDLNIALAIRSLVLKEKVAYLQAGAGIVEDSDPQFEFNETLHKARSLMEMKTEEFF